MHTKKEYNRRDGLKIQSSRNIENISTKYVVCDFYNQNSSRLLSNLNDILNLDFMPPLNINIKKMRKIFSPSLMLIKLHKYFHLISKFTKISFEI